MVDTETYYMKEQPDDKPDLGALGDVMVFGVTDCQCPVCLKFKSRGSQAAKSKFSGYDMIYPEIAKEITSHIKFLCCEYIFAYHLKSRFWGKRRPSDSCGAVIQPLH